MNSVSRLSPLICLQSSTTTRSLTASAVVWDWSHVLDSSDLETRTSKGSESAHGTLSGDSLASTTSGTDSDVDGSDSAVHGELGSVLGSKHGSIWGCLITVSLDLHSTCDTGDCFSSSHIGDVDESVITRSEDVSNTKDISLVSDWFALVAEDDLLHYLLLGCLLFVLFGVSFHCFFVKLDFLKKRKGMIGVFL